MVFRRVAAAAGAVLAGVVVANLIGLAQPERQAAGPVVGGNHVTFYAEGDPSNPPRIVGDFNGWGYVEGGMDPNAGAMKRAGEPGLYSLRITLDPSARIEYLVAYRDRFVPDPGNPLTVPSPTGEPRSELRMPEYRPPAPLEPARLRGTMTTMPFTSRGGESRRVRIHVPHEGTAPMPILYVHDGVIAAEGLDMPAMIDALVESGQMAPIVTAFVSSIDRHEDYAAGSMFRYVFTSEIIPAVEAAHHPIAGARAIIGFSRSALGALDAALNADVSFSRCGLVAPAMGDETIASVVARAKNASTQFAILAGTYDIPLIEDARLLRTTLESSGRPVDWFEVPEGHNHTAWRTQLRRLLTSWFPERRP